jgi:hypothetical protein
MDRETDLWGDPIPPRPEKRGRPQHEVTEEKRLRVAVLRGVAKSQTEIAAALGISERTLRTKYLPELQHGLAQKRAEALVLLWKAGESGNVSALKEFLRRTDLSDLTAPRHEPKPERLGKKAQALADAAIPDQTERMGDLMGRRAEGLQKVH